MRGRGNERSGLETVKTASGNKALESPLGRLPSRYAIYGFVERQVRLTAHTGNPFIQGGPMRYGKPSKSSKLLKVLNRVTQAMLLIASLAVTRFGVLLLVGW